VCEVTLLFTDIESSTRLWEQFPDEMRVALVRHDELLRQAIEGSHGHIFKTIGDAFCAAFEDPTDALRAAATAQRAIAGEQWPTDVVIRVRMGVHRGSCDVRDGDYFGPTVNRTARLEAAAHGGQTVISGPVAQACGPGLPPGTTLTDLGEHRLRDLGEPVRVFQVDIEGLEGRFPPLRVLDSPQLRSNLPIQLTSFIGREHETGVVSGLISGARLVTLTGSGGVGKTRLALQVAADLLDGSGHGAWFVDLAPVASSDLVAPAVAAAIGIRDEPRRAVLDSLVDALLDRRLLVVLDNCEHVIEGSTATADALLRRCPGVKIMATSRQPLGLDGEVLFRVPSLSLPTRSDPGVADLMRTEAVQLLVDRARAHDRGFAVDETNATHVARLCRRLDGIPLAVELAASRLRTLSVAELEARLDDRFRVLTGGSGAGLPRHRTLRALVDWSYDLLSDAERLVLQRLSVFSGGAPLDGAEAVCVGEGVPVRDVVELVTSLVDKCLVRVETRAEPPRYSLLETIGEYARERLAEAGGTTDAHRRHARWVVELLEEAAPHLCGAEQARWQHRLRADHDNIRAALAELAADPTADREVLRYATASARFWYAAVSRPELNEIQAMVLGHPGLRERSLPWAEAVAAIAQVQGQRGELSSMAVEAAAAAAILRSSTSDAACARLLCAIGFHQLVFEGDPGATEVLEEAVARARRSGDRSELGLCLCAAALGFFTGGRLHQTRLLLDEAVESLSAGGDLEAEAVALNTLSLLDIGAGDLRAARGRLDEALHITHGVGDEWMLPMHLAPLGLTWVLEGDLEAALPVYLESLEISERIGSRDPYSLLGLALWAGGMGSSGLAAALHGAAQARLDRSGERLDPVHAAVSVRDQARTLDALGPDAYGSAFARGASLTTDQILTEVRALADQRGPKPIGRSDVARNGPSGRPIPSSNP
jgi:predicted ATPase/class 3 adenylate cyclase